jgi:hypothetical protein
MCCVPSLSQQRGVPLRELPAHHQLPGLSLRFPPARRHLAAGPHHQVGGLVGVPLCACAGGTSAAGRVAADSCARCNHYSVPYLATMHSRVHASAPTAYAYARPRPHLCLAHAPATASSCRTRSWGQWHAGRPDACLPLVRDGGKCDACSLVSWPAAPIVLFCTAQVLLVHGAWCEHGAAVSHIVRSSCTSAFQCPQTTDLLSLIRCRPPVRSLWCLVPFGFWLLWVRMSVVHHPGITRV